MKSLLSSIDFPIHTVVFFFLNMSLQKFVLMLKFTLYPAIYSKIIAFYDRAISLSLLHTSSDFSFFAISCHKVSVTDSPGMVHNGLFDFSAILQ